MSNISKSALICSLIVFLPLASYADEQLVFALDLIRHGARTPYAEIPTAPHSWSEGRGQLTPVGMQQAYQLGVKMRQRYIVDNQLLPANYQTNTLYVRSTDYDRTLMTAQSLLMGLYPVGSGPNLPSGAAALPAQAQPIPIHTIPADQDSAFLIDFSSDEVNALLEQHVYAGADWKNKFEQLAPKFERWSKLSGIKIENLFDVYGLSDAMHSYLINEVPLPSEFSAEDIKEINDAGEWILAQLFKPAPIGDLVGKAALNNIVDQIQKAVNHKAKGHFVLFSAHDVTTLAVMSALHAPLDSTPSYASDLNFSLYQQDTGHYIVKVTYNDKPVNIPGCSGNVCGLSQLVSLFSQANSLVE